MQENQEQTGQSTVSATTPSTESNPHSGHRSPNSFLVILLSILLFISVAIAGFFAYQTQKLFAEVSGYRSMLEQKQFETVNKPTTEPESTLPIYTEPNDLTAGWREYKDSSFSFKYPPEFKIDGKNIYTLDKSIEMWALGTSDALYNECMNLDAEKVIGLLKIKSFSGVTSGEMCDSNNTKNLRERWIVRADGLGYQPGLQFLYKSDNTNATLIFDQILSTFKFTN